MLHIEFNVVIKTKVSNSETIKLTSHWLDNIKVDDFRKMIELYENYKEEQNKLK